MLQKLSILDISSVPWLEITCTNTEHDVDSTGRESKYENDKIDENEDCKENVFLLTLGGATMLNRLANTCPNTALSLGGPLTLQSAGGSHSPTML